MCSSGDASGVTPSKPTNRMPSHANQPSVPLRCGGRAWAITDGRSLAGADDTPGL
jgi:hypothetical protein